MSLSTKSFKPAVRPIPSEVRDKINDFFIRVKVEAFHLWKLDPGAAVPNLRWQLNTQDFDEFLARSVFDNIPPQNVDRIYVAMLGIVVEKCDAVPKGSVRLALVDARTITPFDVI